MATLDRAPSVDHQVAQRNTASLWVIHGGLWFGLICYCWTAWVVSGDFKTNTLGRGQEPGGYVALMRGWEVFALVVTVVIVWVFVIRPKLRDGRLSFDGLFVLACGLMFFQEPWINWTSYQFLYSTTSINFGSWLGHIPGWSSPNAALIPVSMWAGTAYLWLVAIPAMAGSRFMGWLTRRTPGISKPRLIALTYLAFCAFDLVLETFITRTNLFSYGSVIPQLSLFAGTDHQLPVYETISWAGTYVFLSSVHFFRDDRGRSLPERGIDAFRVGGDRLKTFLRFLAIVGIAQLSILLTYNIPYQLYALHSEMSGVYLNQPWRLAGVCGPNTNFDCPGPGVPIPRRDSRTNRVDQSPASSGQRR
jgi:hypothetical protein